MKNKENKQTSNLKKINKSNKILIFENNENIDKIKLNNLDCKDIISPINNNSNLCESNNHCNIKDYKLNKSKPLKFDKTYKKIKKEFINISKNSNKTKFLNNLYSKISNVNNNNNNNKNDFSQNKFNQKKLAYCLFRNTKIVDLITGAIDYSNNLNNEYINSDCIFKHIKDKNNNISNESVFNYNNKLILSNCDIVNDFKLFNNFLNKSSKNNKTNICFNKLNLKEIKEHYNYLYKQIKIKNYKDKNKNYLNIKYIDSKQIYEDISSQYNENDNIEYEEFEDFTKLISNNKISNYSNKNTSNKTNNFRKINFNDKYKSKQKLIAQNVLKNTVYSNSKKPELLRHRHLLGNAMQIHSKHLYELSNNIVPQNNKHSKSNIKKNNILKYYNLPDVKLVEESKVNLNCTDLSINKNNKYKESKNSQFLLSERRSLINSNFLSSINAFDESKLAIPSINIPIPNKYSTNNFSNINKINFIKGKLNIKNADESLLTNKYIHNNIEKLSNVLDITSSINKINEIDNYYKKLAKFRNTKVYNEHSLNKMNAYNNNNNNSCFTINEVKHNQTDMSINQKSIAKERKIKLSREEFLKKFNILLDLRVISSYSKPSSRSNCTINLVKGKLYMFGGRGTKIFNDLWIITIYSLNNLEIDEEEHIWKEIKPEGHIPFPRYGHTTITFNTELFIYGGVLEEYNSKDDIVIYDTSNNIYLKVKSNCKDLSTWRSFHIAHQAGIYMIIYGGISYLGSYLNDIMLYDLRDLKWINIKTEYAKPNGIAYHSSTLVVKKSKLEKFTYHIYNPLEHFENNLSIKYEGIYVFGGIEHNYIKNLINYSNEIKILKFGVKPLTWYYPVIYGKPPEPRAGSSFNYYEDFSCIILYGGYNNTQSFNDIFILDLISFNWIEIGIYNNTLIKKQNHASCICNFTDNMFIFGGSSEDKYNGSDLLEISLDFYNFSKRSDKLNDINYSKINLKEINNVSNKKTSNIKLDYRENLIANKDTDICKAKKSNNFSKAKEDKRNKSVECLVKRLIKKIPLSYKLDLNS